MATVRKVQSKVVKQKVEAPIKEEAQAQPESNHAASQTEKQQSGKVVARVKRCPFCSQKSDPHYWDSAALRRFVSDRGRIVPRTRSGVCAKHQRRVGKQIKYARHLAIMPFMVRV